MADSIPCTGRCHAVITHGEDKGRVCGQLPEHTNHEVWHYFDSTCTHGEAR